ncbi:hypothetical protein BSR29_06980 [Boudabousia liubingyangii]|uniref:Uncharacterized protein n=1 Tax=Boudabousia liubingyangii TaxID=1921764 RepID=A0A1Q5PK11_9ACTO|nr:hypothetical protein [Boudabousia liubingyangii]OKL46565.1 hypothetical protein BSR29_06980 [Boudabousia liubingyangii]OKL46850.1 hypothetical protein BSR28_05310 [Boudabousia liubingyangii]
MNHEDFQPRRPAMLDPEVAEQIPGDEDPAITTSAATTSAHALLGESDEEFTAEQVQQLAHVIQTEGVDTVSALWARSSAGSLAGQLWRLYLLKQWYDREPETIYARYHDGQKSLSEYLAKTGRHLPGLETTMQRIGDLMAGKGTSNLAALLAAAGTLMRVLAAGVCCGPEWITDDHDELADQVTTRAGALIKTSDELLAGARKAASPEGLV